MAHRSWEKKNDRVLRRLMLATIGRSSICLPWKVRLFLICNGCHRPHHLISLRYSKQAVLKRKVLLTTHNSQARIFGWVILRGLLKAKIWLKWNGTVFPEDIPFTCRKSFNAIKGQICEIKWSRPQTCFYGFRSFRETDLTTNASGIKSVILKSDKFCQCEAACYSCLYKWSTRDMQVT